jgi:DNA-binding LytR/AlgR family response regulator
MKVRCIIVDDEPPAVRLISSYVKEVPWLELVATCNSSLEAFTVLQKEKIDLIFLDIKMPRLLGTDFLGSISSGLKVIFITAYRDYALDGYELDVVDFLLKPVSMTRFLKAVTKATKIISLENQSALNESRENENDNENAFLYLKADKEMKKVLVKEILFIESRKEYVKLYLEDNKSLLIKQSISSMEKLLSPHKFVRVHRSFVVTIEKISSFTPNNLTVADYKIPIGRLYKKEVDKVLKHH